MAGKADLAGRVRNIMAKQINRSPMHIGGLLLIAYVAIVLTLPLSAVDVFGMRSYKGDPQDIPTTRELIRDLKDADDPVVRRQAAWWLGEHEDGRAVEPLIDDGLHDSSADVRLVSAWALGEIKDDDAINPLINTLEQDRDPLVREMAALALGEIEDPLAVDALIEALDREEGLAGPVIWAFGEIGNERAARARRAAIATSGWRSGENDQVWAGRLRSKGFAFSSKKFGKRDCSEDIRDSLNDLVSKDPDDRVEAAYDIGALGISGCRESAFAVKPLLETLRDPAPEVRAMAVWALDEINPSRWGKSGQKRDHGHSH
jgi:HEAT repeat protein